MHQHDCERTNGGAGQEVGGSEMAVGGGKWAGLNHDASRVAVSGSGAASGGL